MEDTYRENRLARIDDLKRRIEFSRNEIETWEAEIRELEQENALPKMCPACGAEDVHFCPGWMR